ncbi:TVP38/TMEM64 family protein [Pseudalkalibacillus salsuginis]|uniref:TVP38/TMEM64 family protein n=1 Tax=Pseudalkalibacillus salsuginis TaxID=2910972 RepID=UPI001F2E079D|nr:VTT domain-containing protein [Pseudalkalibacillus salsuginis]MCF6409914.1 VTT domain-containing protein [Pseudalkalibacillus salsuginis]
MIEQKYKLPSEIILHLSLCGLIVYLLTSTMPTMMPVYKWSLVVLVFVLLLLDVLFVLYRKWQLLKVTKVALLYLCSFVLILLLIYYFTKFVALTDTYGIENVLRAYEPSAKFIFFLICLAQPIILPIPEAVTIGAGSAVFGPFSAAILGFIGTMSGIIAMFFIARYGGQKLISKLVKEKHLDKYKAYVEKNETTILILLFIIPILPDEIICVGAGIGAVAFRKFFIIASIAKLLTSTLLAYSVHLAQLLPLTGPQLVFGCTVILAFLYVMSLLFKRYKKNGKHQKAN